MERIENVNSGNSNNNNACDDADVYNTKIFSLHHCTAGSFFMAAFKIISFSDIIKQYGSSLVFCVLGMMIVGGMVFDTGAAKKIGEFLLAKNTKNEKIFLAILILYTGFFSAFFSNTTTTAMFMPIAAGVCAQSEGNIKRKNIMIAVGYASTIGGCATLMGSPTQHQLAQGILSENSYETMSFFYGMKGTAILLALMMIYFVTLGSKISGKVLDHEGFVSDEKPQDITEHAKEYKGYKMILSVAILIAVIVLIALNILKSGEGALLGALLAVSEGFNNCGAGELCVETMFKIFGENASPFVLYAVIMLIALIITNIIDNIAAQALIAPIALSIAQRTGLDVRTTMFSLMVACNIAFLTPISTPCITMTAQEGYRFTDYTKIGAPLTVLSYLTLIFIFPLIYGL